MKGRHYLNNRGDLKYLSRFTLLVLSAIAVAIFYFSDSSFAEGSICASVSIEIPQSVTLERQAFDAHMRINNGLSHITLENVRVEVSFANEAGGSVLASSNPNDPNALFYIRTDTLDNINAVDGTGTVLPSNSADIHWLIIPSPGAANDLEAGTMYYVGATLTYTIGGEERVTKVTPDYIFVKPMPKLTFDYFIPHDVYGDDAFTQEIEPSIPFSLGVRVKNSGAGIARSLKIESAQPKIVENEQGLLIGFLIEASEVNAAPATASLLVNLGDIAPNAASAARWIMNCSLSGQFVDFSATYTHSDELGGELTSLVDSVNTHFLIHDVQVDVNGRDNVRDFLAKDGTSLTVYESNGVDTSVVDESAFSRLTGAGDTFTLTTPATVGAIYIQLQDPSLGQKIIKEVIRSDGKYIKTANAWLSKSRVHANPWEYFFNLFDVNSTGRYMVVFDDAAAQNSPPVLQFVMNRSGLEGAQLSFIVEASDPDGTTPALTASPLPALAKFSDRGDGTALFDWTPVAGQAGEYKVTFTASDGTSSDGSGTDSQTARLIICPLSDSDCDGMSDAWERAHFGNLDRDGTGDFDGDGVSDLEEFLSGSDPANGAAPTAPVIIYPLPGARIQEVSPTLTIENSTDADATPITYEFEIYADLQMTELVVKKTGANQTALTTSWKVGQPLADNRTYFWRVRAGDGANFSLWVYGNFFINSANEPPGEFFASRPAAASVIDSSTPTLEVANSRDPDGDELSYIFSIYSDASMTSLIAESNQIAQGANGTTSWTVGAPLDNGVWYFWQASARDDQGQTRTSAAASFLIDHANKVPQPPSVLAPALGEEIRAQVIDLVVANGSAQQGGPLFYLFEMDTKQTFDTDAKQISPLVSETSGTTSWHVASLADNTLYYWRVLATNGASQSNWAYGRFFVNTVNDPPGRATIHNPGNDAWVDTPRPVLSVNPVTDVDDDPLSYHFALYKDESFSTALIEGDSSTGYWSVPFSLDDTTEYFWRAYARDIHGLGGEPCSGRFFVKDNGIEDPPSITILAPSEEVLTRQGSLLIQWEDFDPDSSASISLFYDSDSAGADGTLIQGSIAADPDGEADDSLAWDIAGLPEGTYYLYATITDNVSEATSYSPGRVRIDRSPPTLVATPAGGTFQSSLMVNLSADEPATIYYTLDGTVPSIGLSSGSQLYAGPVEIAGPTTLKMIAIDAVGNQSAVFTQIYAIERDISVSVSTSGGTFLPGLVVYAYTEAGAYTGKSFITDENGFVTFAPEAFVSGVYRFKCKYLGAWFSSGPVMVPGTSSVQIVIDVETVEIVVETSNAPVASTRVYLFDQNGSYLGQYGYTDDTGAVSFVLPAGINFRFRADLFGAQYWSDVTTVSTGGTNQVLVNTGGGLFEITVGRGANDPLSDINVYLFSAAGEYLGKYQIAAANGSVSFDVPQGSYKVRADYLGYQFWSGEIAVNADTAIDLLIPHHSMEIEVAAQFQGARTPLEAVRVNLFTSAGAYQSQFEMTDSAGLVVFDLPQASYKVRVDYLGLQFWSDPFTWQNTAILVPMGEAQVTVTKSGMPTANVRVNAFSGAEAYLGQYLYTDAFGRATFCLPAQATYKFRADYQSNQYWSDAAALIADVTSPVVLSTGGGSVTVNVRSNILGPLPGVTCEVFNDQGAYLGMFAATNATGQVSFGLADGIYRFRITYMGARFWTDLIDVPTKLSADLLIEMEPVEVVVAIGSSPAVGARINLFSDTGSYLSRFEMTDITGRVLFELPVGVGFTFRVDMFGNYYWSDVLTVVEGGLNRSAPDVGGGLFEISIGQGANDPLPGIKAYLFNTAGAYLSKYQTTATDGRVSFEVPQGSYKIRADYLGYQFWSADTAVTANTSIELPIPRHSVEIAVAAQFQGTSAPLAGVKTYLFTAAGSYLSRFETTNGTGVAVFNLPERSYKIRADYLNQQFWSEPLTWQNGTIVVPQGEVEVTVKNNALPAVGLKVCVFTATESYLSIYAYTDANGKAKFRLPCGTYKFRAEKVNDKYWSTAVQALKDQGASVQINLN